MSLALEIVGVLVLAFGLNAIAGPNTVSPVATAAAVIVVVSALAFWPGLWAQIQGLVQAHSANAALTLEQSNTAGGAAFGVNEGFLAFADNTIPREARVFVDCGAGTTTCGTDEDWLGFRLTPRAFVKSPTNAQWTVFYDANAGSAAFARGWRIVSFAPGFAVAQAPR